MATPIQNFIDKFDGGARPNLFEVQIAGLANIFGADDLKVHCKAAALPASILGEIPINYMGRIIKLPGDRTYEDWTITIINDENMKLRHKFEDWHNQFNQHNANTPSAGGGAGAHMDLVRNTTGVVRQLNRSHEIVREYTLLGMWCDNVAAVDLSYDTPDTISEFTVVLKYQYFQVTKGNGGTLTA
jgi:hypothetical protein